MKKQLFIVGTSDQARVIYDLVQTIGDYNVAGFIGDAPRVPLPPEVPVYDDLSCLREFPKARVVVAIGDNYRRAQVVGKIRRLSTAIEFPILVHPSAIVGSKVSLGAGTVVLSGVCVITGSKIGEHCLLNTASSLDHDGRMGNFSSLAPGARTGGNVTLGEHSAVGLGAAVIHGIHIGKDVVVGAGAIVLAPLPDCVLAYGAPCKVIRSRAVGEPYLQSKSVQTE